MAFHTFSDYNNAVENTSDNLIKFNVCIYTVGVLKASLVCNITTLNRVPL